MNIDFEEVVKALKSINYKGYLTLEADRYMSDFTEETAFWGVKNLYEAADRLRKMF
jgi:sugar phosphate isomerase/epimerase